MKRLHVNVSVSDLDASIGFYSALFAAAPTVRKSDYAKWMLEDPRVNFAITTRGERKGVDHLGIQVEDDAELDEVCARLKNTDAPTVEQGETTCCYAISAKNWAFDPDGIAWESFLTRGDSAVFGNDEPHAKPGAAACCSRPQAAATAGSGCCPTLDT